MTQHMPATRPDPEQRTVPMRCALCATLPICFMSDLPEASRYKIYPLIEERAFAKGELLQPEGRAGLQLSVIKIGAVMLCRQGVNGQPQPVGLLGRGRTLGEYALYGHVEQLSAVALSAGRICRMAVSDFYQLGLVDRRFHARVQKRIVYSHGQLADWSRVMRIRGVCPRLLATLKLCASEQHTRTIRLPSHVALAALLSTTRETVARSLRQLEAKGQIVRHDRWHCEVVIDAEH